MANAGMANNNHSQFAVAMSHLTEFESKHVIFGKVLDGMDILKVMELEGSGEGSTRRKISIDASGELDAAGQPIVLTPPPPSASSASSGGADGETVADDDGSRALSVNAEDALVLEEDGPELEINDCGPMIAVG